MAYTAEQSQRVKSTIDQALAEFRATKPKRSHPADVTADRLADALDKWPDVFDGGDRDAAARMIHVLRGIASGAHDQA